jgi:hypothetical protein
MKRCRETREKGEKKEGKEERRERRNKGKQQRRESTKKAWLLFPTVCAVEAVDTSGYYEHLHSGDPVKPGVPALGRKPTMRQNICVSIIIYSFIYRLL